ncbi:hypothetical protein ACQUFY_16790 [Robbsia andropogonis]|uniref:hypothetical protein n=1 Tax=Robbsia andropogonis TaxID=28092 RepID=UPI003D2052EF
MRIIHDESDDAILAGAAYFRAWRHNRNALLLFDALRKVNAAERAWMTTHGRKMPLRREWQVLRRCVAAGLDRLGDDLIAARTPAATASAIYAGRKRATIARTDQLNNLAIAAALTVGTPEAAVDLLRRWGLPRTPGYLRKRASELGYTPRKGKQSDDSPALQTAARQPQRIEAIGAARRKVHGRAY